MFNKSIFVTYLFMGLLLVACGDESTGKVASNPNEENTALEINVGGETIKALASSKGSLKLPEWIPDNFPIPSESRIFMYTNDKKSGILQIGSKHTPETVANYFYDELKKDGWKDSSGIDGKHQITYSKNKTQVIITVDPARKNKNHSHVTMGFLFK